MTDSRAPDAIYSVRPCRRCGDSMTPVDSGRHRGVWHCPSCGKTSR